MLMLLSIVVAWLMPFKMFLFTYAVLGPIHYLTEIHWLDQRKYFVQNSKWVAWFAGATFLLTLPVIMHLPVLNDWMAYDIVSQGVIYLKAQADLLLLSSLLFAIVLLLCSKPLHVFSGLVLSLLLSYVLLRFVFQSYILVGIFLPTLIHVYLFTMLFMWTGAIKNKSKSEALSVLVLLAIPLLIYAIPRGVTGMDENATTEAMNVVRNFQFILFLGEKFKVISNNGFLPLTEGALKLQVFIAFAYTYHYLNWFSKTKITGWHKRISRKKTAFILLIWFGLVGVSAYDYELGYILLYGLAILHIVLEFPLNIKSIQTVFMSMVNPQEISKNQKPEISTKNTD